MEKRTLTHSIQRVWIMLSVQVQVYLIFSTIHLLFFKRPVAFFARADYLHSWSGIDPISEEAAMSTVLYDQIGIGYSWHRQTDARIAEQIARALGGRP
jgi:hypothetical protein